MPVVVLGFLLGMLHATDADHVVAVSTIVSRQRSLRGAARIGALWGVGHTLTVLLVGGAIILFNLVISPRFGLAMEFAVGAHAGRAGPVHAGAGDSARARDHVARARQRPVGAHAPRRPAASRICTCTSTATTCTATRTATPPSNHGHTDTPQRLARSQPREA